MVFLEPIMADGKGHEWKESSIGRNSGQLKVVTEAFSQK